MGSPRILIGISGWRYAPWRGGAFYPEGLAQHRELAFASRMLPSIELNGSFYSLQRPEAYRRWHEETPEDFVFAVKAPRYLTHRLRLRNIADAQANFFASGLFELGAKLGPLLWQFPPNMAFREEVWQPFLAALPHTTHEAAAIARRHDARMDRRTSLDPGPERPMRHAVEIRHASFVSPAFIGLLREHKVALVVADTAGRWPLCEDLTADFAYLRLHGDVELYASGYSDAALDRWAARIRLWTQGRQPEDARLADPGHRGKPGPRDLYAYFDNDIKVHAPYDAAGLLRRLGLPSGLGPDGRFDAGDALPLRRRATGAGRDNRGS